MDPEPKDEIMSRWQQIDVKNLSIAERILLVEEIWDSIVADQEILGITEAQKGELDFRLESRHNDPDLGSTWEELKKGFRLRSDPQHPGPT
jgi:putative addiction module component (TIGR02574 family)